MASLDRHFLSAPTLALVQGRSDLTCLIFFWSSFGKLISMDNFPSHLQKEPCRGWCARVHACHEDGWGSGTWESRGPTGRSLSPCLQLCRAPWQPPPSMPDFLLLACVLLCLPRAPKHLANSVCGERSPRVISGRIPPLYSWLINSGYRVSVSYRLQECPPQREVNITARAGSPFLWQWILIKSFTPFSCCWLQLSVFKADSPCANLEGPFSPKLNIWVYLPSVQLCQFAKTKESSSVNRSGSSGSTSELRARSQSGFTNYQTMFKSHPAWEARAVQGIKGAQRSGLKGRGYEATN